MNKCLYCYEPLENGEKDFHRRCARRIFKSDEAPELSYSRYEIGYLAKEVIRSQTTLTGVQAKLSLDLIPADETGCRRFTIVGLWGRFILKPQTDIFRNLPEVEDLTMHLAEAAKIAVVPHTLMRFAVIACYFEEPPLRDKSIEKREQYGAMVRCIGQRECKAYR